MPSFDISSDVDWQEVDNALQQAQKELGARFDFKSVKTELKMDKKAKTVSLWSSDDSKLEAIRDIIYSKLVKRGVSLLSIEQQDPEPAFGGSVRQILKVQAGIEKEKGKEIMAALKESKIKVQGQIQDEQVRVTGKNRDDLQTAIAYLKGKQESMRLPMQFGNFRD